jgi:hypothetical protein
MCLPDLLQVFYGSHQPLNRLRTPLREFMRGRVLNDGEPTPENIDAGDHMVAGFTTTYAISAYRH